MKVFVIPSWFPSDSKPHYGIFIQEQLKFLAREKPEWEIGVSTWGQGDSRKLLWASDHLINIKKAISHSFDKPSTQQISANLTYYYQPALSWTKRIKKGNLDNLIKASALNFDKFQKENGLPDILWVQASYPGAFIAQFLSEKYHIPYVAHVRFGGYMFQNLLRDTGKMSHELIKCINAADQVTMTSQSQLQSLRKYIPQASVFANPVDTDFFTVQENEAESILAIGRLEKEKGFDLLIEAMQDVDSRLTVVGSGSLLRQAKAQVEKLGLETKISFVGEQDRNEVRNLIQRCSFLVLPSSYETFGNVLIEAMACGKPVVATKCGGPDTIVTEEVGYLCEPNAKDLAEKINGMISNRSTFEATKIRKEVEERFSPEVWAKKIDEMFKSVVSS